MQYPKCLSPSPEDCRWSPPVDVRDLAIRLETEGVSDSVAHADFGFEDTWEMAATHFPGLPSRAEPEQPVDRDDPPRSALLEYLVGASFALPLLFSCLAILYFRFSLWGGDLPAAQASAIGLGIACSFIASGGFVQAMTRQGLWYAGTGQHRRCASSTAEWLLHAAMVLLGVGLAGIAASVYFDWFPQSSNFLTAAFFYSLSLLWLATGTLYMLERNLLVALAAVLGIGNVVFLHRLMHVDLLAAQLVSILAAACFMTACSFAILRRRTQSDPGESPRQSPARTFYHVWPYFVYGCLYYVFLFSDRLMAWTAHNESSGLALQFRGSYEAGQDVALFAFIFQVGWVHSSTVRFYERLRQRQRELPIGERAAFNRSLTRSYWQAALRFIPLAALTTVTVYAAAWKTGFFADQVHRAVATWALAGFLLLVLSLRNVSLLFALSCPGFALRAIAAACAFNIASGYLLSRFGTYDMAAGGFALGALAFAAVSTWYALQTLANLDYRHFASGA